jgi:hypothetical protein
MRWPIIKLLLAGVVSRLLWNAMFVFLFNSIHVSPWPNLFSLYASLDIKMNRLISITFLFGQIIFELARLVVCHFCIVTSMYISILNKRGHNFKISIEI